MDTWLYRVLKDTLDLHKINEQQAKELLNRLLRTIFPDEK